MFNCFTSQFLVYYWQFAMFFLQSLLYSWNSSLTYFFRTAITSHKARIHCIIFLNPDLVSWQNFLNSILNNLAFVFSVLSVLQTLKSLFFSGRIYIFFSEWTFKTAINRLKKIIKCTVLESIQKNISQFLSSNIFSIYYRIKVKLSSFLLGLFFYEFFLSLKCRMYCTVYSLQCKVV